MIVARKEREGTSFGDRENGRTREREKDKSIGDGQNERTREISQLMIETRKEREGYVIR